MRIKLFGIVPSTAHVKTANWLRQLKSCIVTYCRLLYHTLSTMARGCVRKEKPGEFDKLCPWWYHVPRWESGCAQPRACLKIEGMTNFWSEVVRFQEKTAGQPAG